MSTVKAEVAVSYDVSNEFFRLWLDERMNYTCAVFEKPTDTLEQAQLNKLRILSEYAHIDQNSTVLDIGCGWGANLEYQALQNKVKAAHGITLSEAQFAEINRRKLPNTTAHCVSYVDYKPPEKFDAIMSICMIEHVARPEDARSGKHIEKYRNYFRLAHEWSKPGSYFALQTILRNRVPRDRKDLKDVGWVTYNIFPGGISVRLEDIIQSVNPYWEVVEVKTRRVDYQKTCDEWRARLRRNEKLVREKWGSQVFEDYDRYLSCCVRAFDQHYQSLAQYSLKRIDF